MDTLEALKTRRSVRAFAKKDVSRQILADLVDCARLAPSAMNQQQWEFVVVTEPQTLARIAALIAHAPFIADAAAAIAVLVGENKFNVEDGAAATQNILLAAHAHGLGSCWISGDKQPYAAAVGELLGAPASCQFFSLIPVGYPTETPTKEKRALENLLHWDRY